MVSLRAPFGEEPTYRVPARGFSEHFRQEPKRPVVKAGSELNADGLPSPDDPKATYREKRGRGCRGYGVNVTGTRAPENPARLITKVQVEPNVDEMPEKEKVTPIPTGIRGRSRDQAKRRDQGELASRS